MKKINRILLPMGAIAAVGAPITTLVSCNNLDGTLLNSEGTGNQEDKCLTGDVKEFYPNRNFAFETSFANGEGREKATGNFKLRTVEAKQKPTFTCVAVFLIGADANENQERLLKEKTDYTFSSETNIIKFSDKLTESLSSFFIRTIGKSDVKTTIQLIVY